MTADPIEVALLVAGVFDRHDVRYVLGGSLASSISGEPRSTLDVDLLVALDEDKIDALTTELQSEFYVDPEAIRRAIRNKSSANLIHLATSIKVDLFIMGATPIDEQQMDRRQRLKIATDPDRHLYVYTPEDILLKKLRWYRLGEEKSDRQWRDILGIAGVQGDRLDRVYLRRSAEILAVSDLLKRVFDQDRQQG